MLSIGLGIVHSCYLISAVTRSTQQIWACIIFLASLAFHIEWPIEDLYQAVTTVFPITAAQLRCLQFLRIISWHWWWDCRRRYKWSRLLQLRCIYIDNCRLLLYLWYCVMQQMMRLTLYALECRWCCFEYVIRVLFHLLLVGLTGTWT